MMNLTAKYNRRVESVMSVLILLVLTLIGVGILIRQNDVDISRFGINLTTDGPASQTTAQSAQQSILETVIPDDFRTLSETETYFPDNLYEKINGKAPLYIDCGFVELSAQRIVSTKDENLWVEIGLFDMGNQINAFSILSVQRRPDAANVPLFNPSFGYKTSNALYFIQGKNYIEMVGSAESEYLSAAMISTAQNLLTKLASDQNADIPQLSLFVPENLIEGSIKIYLKNAFGFEGFSDVFSCRYQINNVTITAFLSQYPDPQTAQAKAESYYNFLIEYGGNNKTTTNEVLKNNRVKVVDFYDTTEIVFATGNYIGGIHEAANQQAAEDLAARLLEKLSQQPVNQ